MALNSPMHMQNSNGETNAPSPGSERLLTFWTFDFRYLQDGFLNFSVENFVPCLTQILCTKILLF